MDLRCHGRRLDFNFQLGKEGMMNTGQWVFTLVMIATGVWMCWMASCRPEQWEQLVENDRRRKKETLRGLMKVGTLGWKAYKGMK
jgi:hypothetical protein